MTRNCCPHCATSLDGGPIEFRCSRCIRTVYAADLDLEFHPPAPIAQSVAPPRMGA